MNRHPSYIMRDRSSAGPVRVHHKVQGKATARPHQGTAGAPSSLRSTRAGPTPPPTSGQGQALGLAKPSQRATPYRITPHNGSAEA